MSTCQLLSTQHVHHLCRNPCFGLATKAKGLQGCGPRESPGVKSHIPGSVRKCEGVNLHIPKAPTLGYGIPWTPEIVESNFRGQKLMACNFFYIIGKLLKPRCLKWVQISHLDI